jgi:hypothetical protein
MKENVDFVFADEPGVGFVDKPTAARRTTCPPEKYMVASGLRTLDQMIGVIGKWRAQEIEHSLIAKQTEEKTWPQTTDVDKLEQAFALLSEQHIMDLWALDGESHEDWVWDDELYVDQFRQCVGGDASGYLAAVYYSWDDLTDAIDHGVLSLRLRGFDDGHGWSREQSAASARMALQEALSDAGLRHHWNSAAPELVLVQLNWQRRHPGEPVMSFAERQMTPFSRVIKKSMRSMGYHIDDAYHSS